MQPAGSPGATIYDLGYASYTGARLGRGAVFLALYVQGVRTVFGLGRRNRGKVLPIGLTILTFLPAAIQLGIAAVAAGIVEVFRAEEYYGYIQWLLALFVAATATELLGRDRRHRVLPLHFSRSLRRADYVTARLAAMVTSLLGLTLLPQAVLFVGNALAGNDIDGYLRENWSDIAPILGSALAISVYYATLSLFVASLTTRRAFGGGAILAYFALSTVLGSSAVEFGSADLRRYGLLVSGFHSIQGLARWMFKAGAEPGSVLADSGLALFWYAPAVGLVAVLCAGALYRRYGRLAL